MGVHVDDSPFPIINDGSLHCSEVDAALGLLHYIHCFVHEALSVSLYTPINIPCKISRMGYGQNVIAHSICFTTGGGRPERDPQRNTR